METAEQKFRSRRGEWMLWAGILIGPIAWATDFVISYAIVQHACSTGHTRLLHILTIAALLVTAAAFAIAWRSLRDIPMEAREYGGSVLDRSRFMAIGGIVLSAGFALAIVASAIPRFMLSPCDSP
jgi:NO-binding membrane sensor protein with MHYT domain